MYRRERRPPGASESRPCARQAALLRCGMLALARRLAPSARSPLMTGTAGLHLFRGGGLSLSEYTRKHACGSKP
jgi:hypothetical protein